MIYDLSSVPEDRLIITNRVIPFSPAQVFEAFRDPNILATWWGPSGFTNTFNTFDFREGGDWIFTMHSPDGKDYANEGRFVKLEEPSLVILDHVCAPIFQAQFRLKDCPEGCVINWCMVFEDAKTCASISKLVGEANEQNLDRLEAALGRVG